jgi:hypothetical protein
VQMAMHGIETQNILRAENFRMSSHMLNSDKSRNSSYAQKSIFYLEDGSG